MVVVAGLSLAFTTAILYATAVGLQALEARESPQEQHLRISLLRRLITRPRWLIGTGLALLGWIAQVGALLLIPLTLVEPALAMSLVVLLVIGSRVLGERVGRREILSVSAMVAGIALLAWCAPAARDRPCVRRRLDTSRSASWPRSPSCRTGWLCSGAPRAS